MIIRRTATVKLLTSADQSSALSALAEYFSQACNSITVAVQENRCWNRVALHHLSYYSIRNEFPNLGSQMACNVIHRVANAYKAIKPRKDEPVKLLNFKSSTVHFDKRTYSIKDNMLSIFTMGGRIKVPFVTGEYQKNIISSGVIKEADLVNKNGVWYFNFCIDIPLPKLVESSDVMGVDVGENNLAATSTGKVFGGGKLRHDREKYFNCRRRLQSNGSRAAKRKLKSISGKESRHVRHVNHEVSKMIVTEAINSGAGEIRLEDLTNIRSSVKTGKRVRARLHKWAFRQLQDFVCYKAEFAGLKITFVDPAYTSKTCSCCGGIGKRVKHQFSCTCGNQRHSDVNAAVNIAGFAKPIGSARAVINQPKLALL